MIHEVTRNGTKKGWFGAGSCGLVDRVLAIKWKNFKITYTSNPTEGGTQQHRASLTDTND